MLHSGLQVHTAVHMLQSWQQSEHCHPGYSLCAAFPFTLSALCIDFTSVQRLQLHARDFLSPLLMLVRDPGQTEGGSEGAKEP